MLPGRYPAVVWEGPDRKKRGEFAPPRQPAGFSTLVHERAPGLAGKGPTLNIGGVRVGGPFRLPYSLKL